VPSPWNKFLVAGYKGGTDPSGAKPKNLKLSIILNNQLNLNDSQTIALQEHFLLIILAILLIFPVDYCLP